MVSSLLAVSPAFALWALACPVGMGAMMWLMARGGRSEPSQPSAQQPSTLDDLRLEHQRLGAQIEALEGNHVDASRATAVESVPPGRSDNGWRWRYA
jgi:hypothetical protein